jgi:hypothetical protein
MSCHPHWIRRKNGLPHQLRKKHGSPHLVRKAQFVDWQVLFYYRNFAGSVPLGGIGFHP